MRKLTYPILTLMLSAMAIYLCSCASGGVSIDLRRDPIKPSPELKEGTVDLSTNTITMTKDDITVTLEHWSRARLDRKFTTSTQRSPFFYLDTWPQSMQSEVFYVTVTNNTPRSIVFDFKETTLNDERQYQYVPTTYDEIRYKFVSKSYMDLKTKQGLEAARQVLLSERIGKDGVIAAGKTVEGFLPFFTPSPQAEKVWTIITFEKEPEVATLAYEKAAFRFDYKQDLALRASQPPTKR